MTREEAKHWLEIELKTWEDECKSKHPIKEAFSVAIETLEQEPVIDKISAEIEEAALDDVNGSKFIFVNRVNQIIDKYKAESEDKEMVNNLKLGDTYYTEDNYGEVTGYIFVARQGQFIIGTARYRGYSIVDQLHQMCEETLEEDGVNMYVHYADKCYPTYEEAEKNIVGSGDKE